MNVKNYITTFLFLIITITLSIGQSSNLGTVCAESDELYGVDGYRDSEFTWAVEGGVIIDGEGEDTVNIRWGYKTGTYRMEVVELTSANCVGVPSIATVTVQAPEVDLGYDYFEICDEDSMTFDARGDYDGTSSYVWHDSSTSSNYTGKISELIWVKVTDGLGCERYDSIDFTVHPLPVVYIGRDTVLCDVETPMQITAVDSNNNDFASYEWYSASKGGLVSVAPSLFIGPGRDTVTLEIADFNGCAGSDTLVIFACSVREMFRDMVNTFTPNGDAQNDVWNIIEFMHLFPDAVLEVFDRWGRMVYRTEDVANEPWDGKSNGREMPMDSYFYVLELNYMNFEALSGTVNLVR